MNYFENVPLFLEEDDMEPPKKESSEFFSEDGFELPMEDDPDELNFES